MWELCRTNLCARIFLIVCTCIVAGNPGRLPFLLRIVKLQLSLGLQGLLYPVVTRSCPMKALGYTPQEIGDKRRFSGFVLNDTFIAQIVNSPDFIQETQRLPYPQSVPYLKIVSGETYERLIKQHGLSGEEYRKRHLLRIGAQA